jgi:hypothetical protein
MAAIQIGEVISSFPLNAGGRIAFPIQRLRGRATATPPSQGAALDRVNPRCPVRHS